MSRLSWNYANVSGHRADAAVICLTALPDGRLVASDELGGLHWLEIVE